MVWVGANRAKPGLDGWGSMPRPVGSACRACGLCYTPPWVRDREGMLGRWCHTWFRVP